MRIQVSESILFHNKLNLKDFNFEIIPDHISIPKQ